MPHWTETHDPELHMPVEQLHDETDEFDKVQELADEGMYPIEKKIDPQYPPIIDSSFLELPDPPCWQCEGKGWGIIGVNWDCDDSVNGPYDSELEKCPCCSGSGDADDCTYW